MANDVNLMFFLKADGLYISAKNKNLNMVNFKKSNFSVIGAAHNVNEIMQKKTKVALKYFFQEYLTNYLIKIKRFPRFNKI